MSGNGPADAQIAALTQRVTGVEAAVDSIRKDIHSLVTKFDERSRMPWGTLLAAATLFWMVITSFVTIGGGVVAWGLLSQNANIVSNLNEFKQSYEANRLISRQDTNAKFAEVSEALARSVPREEHQRVWAAQLSTDDDQQRQIDETKAVIASLYGVKDFFKEMSEWRNRTDKTVTDILKQISETR